MQTFSMRRVVSAVDRTWENIYPTFSSLLGSTLLLIEKATHDPLYLWDIRHTCSSTAGRSSMSWGSPYSLRRASLAAPAGRPLRQLPATGRPASPPPRRPPDRCLSTHRGDLGTRSPCPPRSVAGRRHCRRRQRPGEPSPAYFSLGIGSSRAALRGATRESFLWFQYRRCTLLDAYALFIWNAFLIYLKI
jgi:hypothetical protein